MSYSIIQPPFTLRFREMSKAELKQYNEWFLVILPARIAELEKEVRRSKPNWRANRKPSSLAALDKWFATAVTTRPRTAGELAEIKLALSFQVEIPEYELTNRTYSLAIDVGMYFAEVLRENLKGLHWTYSFRAGNYGQPVLSGFVVPFNPVQIALVVAEKHAGRYDEAEKELRRLYEVWSGKIVAKK